MVRAPFQSLEEKLLCQDNRGHDSSPLLCCLGGHQGLKSMHPTKFLGCNSWTLPFPIPAYSISREFPRSILKCETVLGTLDATSKVP